MAARSHAGKERPAGLPPFKDEKKNVAHAVQAYAKMSLYARTSCGLFREKIDQKSMLIHP
jgi:hypothetical protein